MALVEGHVSLCPACRAEAEAFRWIATVRNRSRATPHELPAHVRSRIAAEAVVSLKGRGRWTPLPLSLDWLAARPGMLAAAAAMALAVLALPVVMHRGAGPSRQADVTRIYVQAESGTVRLAWSDGRREQYTVFKSSDPRTFSQREAHVVRGNVWTDSHPESSPIVFYRIE
jgi:hypothetical protein